MSHTSPQLLCSSGAFSRDPGYTDHRALLHFGPRLAVDGIEVIIYPDWYPSLDRVASDLQGSGLSFPVVHADKNIGAAFAADAEAERREALEKLAINCQLARAIGSDLVVLHLWGLPGGDNRIERNLAALPACYDTAQEHRIALAIETIPCDCGTPLDHLDRAAEMEDRVLVALDTEFLAIHAQLDETLAADWLWDAGRAHHIHIKDYDGVMRTPEGERRYLHPGEGGIDFPTLFRILARRGFNGSVSLEASALDRDGTVDLRRIQESLAVLRKWTGGTVSA